MAYACKRDPRHRLPHHHLRHQPHPYSQRDRPQHHDTGSGDESGDDYSHPPEHKRPRREGDAEGKADKKGANADSKPDASDRTSPKLDREAETARVGCVIDGAPAPKSGYREDCEKHSRHLALHRISAEPAMKNKHETSVKNVLGTRYGDPRNTGGADHSEKTPTRQNAEGQRHRCRADLLHALRHGDAGKQGTGSQRVGRGRSAPPEDRPEHIDGSCKTNSPSPKRPRAGPRVRRAELGPPPITSSERHHQQGLPEYRGLSGRHRPRTSGRTEGVSPPGVVTT